MKKKTKYTCSPSDWVENFSDEFYRFAIFRVRKKDVAEDLVQDTFLSGLNSIDKFRGDCPEKSWLYNILRNKIIDHFRKKTNQEVQQSATVFDTDSDDVFFQYFNKTGKYPNHWSDAGAPQEWEVTAETVMERDEFMRFLMLCMTLLPETWSKVFSLKNIDEYSTKEICKELNLTSSNLWTIIHRAKLQLRGCLEKKWLDK